MSTIGLVNQDSCNFSNANVSHLDYTKPISIYRKQGNFNPSMAVMLNCPYLHLSLHEVHHVTACNILTGFLLCAAKGNRCDIII